MASTEKRSDLIALARELNGVPMCDDYEKMISGMLCVFFPCAVYNPDTRLDAYSIIQLDMRR